MPIGGEGTTTEYRISVRFGDDLLQTGFTAIPNLVLDHYTELGISPLEMMFIIHIWQYWWTEKDPYPSLKTIATKMKVDRRTTQRYVESLKQKKLLLVTPRTVPGLGQVTSEYDFSPLTVAVRSFGGGSGATPQTNLSRGGMTNLSGVPWTDLSTEEDPGKQDEDQEDESLISNQRSKSHLHKDYSFLYGKKPLRSRSIVDNPGSTTEDDEVEGDREAPTQRAASVGLAKVAEVLQQRQLRPVPATPRGNTRGRPPKATPLIEATIQDIAAKLHDDNAASSVTRAMRLLRTAGMDEHDFVYHVLHPARSTTQQQGGVKGKPAQGDRELVNRMPYFFAVVEDLLGMKAISATNR